MAASVRTLQGTITMPIVTKDPLEDRRALVGERMRHGRKRLHLFGRIAGFVHQRARTPAAHHQVRFNVGAAQHLEQAHPENRPARAGDANDEAAWSGHRLSVTPPAGAGERRRCLSHRSGQT